MELTTRRVAARPIKTRKSPCFQDTVARFAIRQGAGAAIRTLIAPRKSPSAYPVARSAG